jgi:hypothetical protein
VLEFEALELGIANHVETQSRRIYLKGFPHGDTIEENPSRIIAGALANARNPRISGLSGIFAVGMIAFPNELARNFSASSAESFSIRCSGGRIKAEQSIAMIPF